MDPAALQRRLLHLGGAADDSSGGGVESHWGNLGLWPGTHAGTAPPTAPSRTPPAHGHTHADTYAGACRALALAVGTAAGLQPGQRVLSLACGAGDELLLWAGHFSAAQVLGVEIDPQAAALAARRTAGQPAIQVLCRSALALQGEPTLGGPFDAIVCVDAAYHLAPRRSLLAALLPRLRPGGRLAYADLTLRAAGASPLLRAAARLCGVPAADLLPLAQQLQRLQALGYTDVQGQALDEAVLGGFARFAARHAAAHGLRPWQAGWRRVAATAALIPPCRAAGLGYALLSAAAPQPSRPATTAAERTALSSSGTPACA